MNGLILYFKCNGSVTFIYVSSILISSHSQKLGIYVLALTYVAIILGLISIYIHGVNSNSFLYLLSKLILTEVLIVALEHLMSLYDYLYSLYSLYNLKGIFQYNNLSSVIDIIAPSDIRFLYINVI